MKDSDKFRRLMLSERIIAILGEEIERPDASIARKLDNVTGCLVMTLSNQLAASFYCFGKKGFEHHVEEFENMLDREICKLIDKVMSDE